MKAMFLLLLSDHAGCIHITDITRLTRSRISQPEMLAAAVSPPVHSQWLLEQFASSLLGAWSLLRSMIWGYATVDETAVDSSAVRTMSFIAEELDRRLAAKDYERAAALLDPQIEWQTPQWRAVGHAAVKETWASGIDDKWGITPVWRKVSRDNGPGLVFTRECDTFRVMGWPIRLRQTFHVRKKGFGFVVLKAITVRL
eukprot:CAMPEP_0119094144 /NCGR_PEP_ID=MMETSP1178-20130426/165289_1 /TAXON_ID=33656 /ORGANISM="unid sp, Strain CCMP2000" /LENGTH=198 /DNA_ID=CAMNT_0007077855 /DNA_START=75 /DNA_END=671 /DNA_ORIENTATION=+